MRLVVRCSMHGFPVEVDVTGDGLDPSGACDILASCLEKVDTMLDEVTLEKVDRVRNHIHPAERGRRGAP